MQSNRRYNLRMASKLSLLLKTAQVTVQSTRHIDSLISPFPRIPRKQCKQTYPTVLQFPDGSTINIQYHEPVGIIKLPLDLSTLSEAERKERLKRRVVKTKVKITEEVEDDYDESRYIKKK